MEIVIQSLLTGLNDNTLNELRNDISREFEHIRVRITSVANKISNSSLKSDAAYNSLFNSDRNQWNSPKLLEWFHKNFKTKKDRRMLLILDIDAYSNGLNFVLGEASPNAGLGVVYLPRIKEEFYGQKPNEKLFYERMIKECVHELGHLFGLNHCANTLCVMHFSNTLYDTDVKATGFCDRCRISLKSNYN
jgi:archaemetzincin